MLSVRICTSNICNTLDTLDVDGRFQPHPVDPLPAIDSGVWKFSTYNSLVALQKAFPSWQRDSIHLYSDCREAPKKVSASGLAAGYVPQSGADGLHGGMSSYLGHENRGWRTMTSLPQDGGVLSPATRRRVRARGALRRTDEKLAKRLLAAMGRH